MHERGYTIRACAGCQSRTPAEHPYLFARTFPNQPYVPRLWALTAQVGNTYGHGNILDILDGGIRFLSYATVMLDGIGTIALQGITSTPDVRCTPR